MRRENRERWGKRGTTASLHSGFAISVPNPSSALQDCSPTHTLQYIPTPIRTASRFPDRSPVRDLRPTVSKAPSPCTLRPAPVQLHSGTHTAHVNFVPVSPPEDDPGTPQWGGGVSSCFSQAPQAVLRNFPTQSPVGSARVTELQYFTVPEGREEPGGGHSNRHSFTLQVFCKSRVSRTTLLHSGPCTLT